MQRAAGHHEVGPHREVRAVDEEILLLGAERGVDAIHALVAEQLEQLDGFGGQRVGAAEQRRRFVERFAVVADEHRRNAQRLHARPLGDEHRARRIPRRVAARFPRRAQIRPTGSSRRRARSE